MRWQLLAILWALLTGCYSSHSYVLPGHAVEIDGVPFFPQERYQCGPAALATTLGHSGVVVEPEDLVPLVYVPARRGSFQAEMKAAARRYERIPFELMPRPEALFEEVAGGNPVLVLQNLGFDWLPKWHYAVVVGFDATDEIVILRSGIRARRRESLNGFLRSWQRADNWAILTVRPGHLPATAAAEEYVRSIAESEEFLTTNSVSSALDAGIEKWPDFATLLFASANHQRVLGDNIQSAELYRRALEIEPDHPGALNNYADLLLEESCLASAEIMIKRGSGVVDERTVMYDALADTGREIAIAIAASGRADDGANCAVLTE